MGDRIETDPALKALVLRFAESKACWLCTVRPEGRPHSTPVWHVWHRSRVYVITTSNAVKTANIRNNPEVVITHPDTTHPLIIEGSAAPAHAMRTALRPLFQSKYEWDIEQDVEYDFIIEITPTRLLAWGKYGEGRWSGEAVGAVPAP